MMSRVVSMSCAFACLLGALSLSGCASPGSKAGTAETARGDSPRVTNPEALTGTANCACTLEHRMNLCVTVNDGAPIPTSASFVREHDDGTSDPLDPGPCFGERRGIQRVLMLQGATRVDSSGWFEIQTVDCCHGEAKTVNFKR